MTSIGETLRRERLRRNLQLEQISSELKISSRMLAAIEAEDFGKLPGGVFAKSFVRQYAHLLGLDEEELASEVERVLTPEAPLQTARPDTRDVALPRMEAWQSVGDQRHWTSGWFSSLPALVGVVVVMLICSAVYAYWQQRPRTTSAARTPAVHRETAAVNHPAPSVPAPAPQSAERSAEPEAPKQPAAASPATPPPAAEPGKPAETAFAATPPGPVHVEITATEPVWIRATSDGKFVFSGTLDASQTRTVDAGEKVELRVGNAAGVTVLLNGKSIGPLGPKGQVRNIQLTSGGFQILPPKSAEPIDPL